MSFGLDPGQELVLQANVQERRRLEKEISRLRAALEKYADKNNWDEEYNEMTNTGSGVHLYVESPEPWTIAQEALSND